MVSNIKRKEQLFIHARFKPVLLSLDCETNNNKKIIYNNINNHNTNQLLINK